MKYKHLTVEEREKIQEMLWRKCSVSDIALAVGRNPSSISREINKNRPSEVRRYTPRIVHDRAMRQRKSRGRKAIGHWEDDCIISRATSDRLKTINERVSGLVFIAKIKDGTIEQTNRAIRKRLAIVPRQFRKILTRDRGSENMGYLELEYEVFYELTGVALQC